MSEPRSAAAMGAEFPYQLSTLCYIEVRADGSVTQGADTAAYQRALAGESRLFAVWPCNWRSDLFVFDDLDQYARGIGLIHDETRTGLADHEHQMRWKKSPYETKPNASYISIELEFDCGCEIKDLHAFAEQMRQQRGWDIATSSGWGSRRDSGGSSYNVRVRRKSLAQD